MPGYQHSCFISYKHPPVHDTSGASRHFWMEFITAFQAKLEAFITIELKTYRDDQLQSIPGVKYPAELSRKLCRSVCMIAILVPEYMESSWCRAEWKAMEQLERQRTSNPAVGGFIIPILFRGHSDRVAQFCNGRVFIDFSHIVKPSTELNSKDSRKKIEEIAQRVAELAKYHSSTDCSNFVIDIGEEIVEPSFDDPSPLT
jgi:hypothetical protein